MEARRIRAVVLAAGALLALTGASARSRNFVFQTSDPRLAEAFAQAAEKYRHDLAIQWTGEALPDWSQPCLVTATVGAHLGAGGATTFVFDRGEVYGWRMTIQGSAERILDSVLPHEITHMILASHFRAPIPRWADEGAATSVEHPSERDKHRRMLVQFLQTGRGIPFNRMFAMTEYPTDIMPLYAQAQSVVDYLIQTRGRRAFVAFLEEAMRDGQWAKAVERHYGFRDLGSLQNTWVAWVARGCPQLAPAPARASPEGEGTLLASTGRRPRPEPNLIWRAATRDLSANRSDDLVPIQRPTRNTQTPEPALRAQLTRPQPLEQPRQIILEWSKP